LDAIHYLSFCKSFFSSLDIHNVRHGDDFFALHGNYIRNDSRSDLVQCLQKKNQKKRFLINKKEYERLADHIGNFPLVMISPYDRDLINDGSEYRRRYLDSVISQFDKLYLDNLIQYNKALVQRNTLLKSFAEKHYFDAHALEIWDEPLIGYGQDIFARRCAFLSHFVPIFQQYFSLLSNGSENVDIGYISQFNDGNYRQIFCEALPKDRAAQHCTAGIHKDDLEMLLDGFAVKRYGSQGQQKSFVIAIKLAQFEYTRQIKGFKPILLLDDVFDKLDDLRVAQLIKLVSENSFGQVFITDTSKDRISAIFDDMQIEHRIFNIPPK
jgi:DNA replication and repair protein RecF